MLFRQSGQSYNQSRMTNDSGIVECKQSFVNLPSSDTQLSSSVSVTGSEHLIISEHNSESVSSSMDYLKPSNTFAEKANIHHSSHQKLIIRLKIRSQLFHKSHCTSSPAPSILQKPHMFVQAHLGIIISNRLQKSHQSCYQQNSRNMQHS